MGPYSCACLIFYDNFNPYSPAGDYFRRHIIFEFEVIYVFLLLPPPVSKEFRVI